MYCYIVFTFVFCACNNAPKCKYSPEPIFDASWENIQNHSFEKQDTKATEQLTFSNGVQLSIFQNICNDSKQEFHFTVPGDYKAAPDAFWIAQAANQFFYMAELNEQIQSFAMWGLEIQKDPAKYVLGEKVSLENSMTLKIDKLVGNSDAKIIITIEEKT
ncbi:MAG: hypothetical protein AAF573_16525 [Bacteroidota bacterium]